MKWSLTATVLAITAALASGCGTVCNFAGAICDPHKELTVYGGVKRDVEFLEQMVDARPTDATTDPRLGYVMLACVLADHLLSGLADTLTLPITIHAERAREAELSNSGAADNPQNSTSPGQRAASLGIPTPALEIENGPQ